MRNNSPLRSRGGTRTHFSRVEGHRGEALDAAAGHNYGRVLCEAARVQELHAAVGAARQRVDEAEAADVPELQRLRARPAAGEEGGRTQIEAVPTDVRALDVADSRAADADVPELERGRERFQVGFLVDTERKRKLSDEVIGSIRNSRQSK